MVHDDRSTRYRTLEDAFPCPRQRPHARVGVEHIAMLDSQPWQDSRCFGDQVVDFPAGRANVRRFVVVSHVGRADDVVAQPGSNEHRATVGARAGQYSVPGTATVKVDDQVRPSRTSDAAAHLASGGVEHRINPGAGRVDDQPSRCRRPATREDVMEVHAACSASVDDDVVDRGVVAQIRAGRTGLG